MDDAIADRARVVAAALVCPWVQVYEATAIRIARREVRIVWIRAENSLAVPQPDQAERLKFRRRFEDIGARVLKALPVPQQTGEERSPAKP